MNKKPVQSYSKINDVCAYSVLLYVAFIVLPTVFSMAWYYM